MKICHINLASKYNGGENQTLALIKQQIKAGYDLTVVANPKSRFADEIKKLNCKLYLTTHYLFNHAKKITQDCKLIHVHEGRAIYWALIQSKLFDIPYIVTRRIDNPLKKRFLFQYAVKNASYFIGLSGAICDELAKFIPSDKIFKIPSSPVKYPVDEKKLHDLKAQFQGKIVVIQAANMVKHKAHDLTIQASKYLDKNIQIVFLGDGVERQNLENFAQNQKNITFVGKQNDMGNWFALADIFIHPSYSEGLGSVILEAMLAGVPVIGSKAGGIVDLIEDQYNGELIEIGDFKALANKINNLVKNPKLQQKYIENSLQKLEKFKIEYTADLYAEIYKLID